MFGWLKRRTTDDESQRKRGDALLARDDFAGAMRCYLEAIAHDPADVKALTSLGFAESQQGLAKDAIAHLAQAVALDPSGPDPFYMLGTLHEQSGALELAIENFSRAVELAPGFELAVRDLSRVLFQAGRPQDARGVLLRGLALNPEFPDYHDYLGNLQMAAGQLEEAAASYAKAVALDANRLGALVHLGMAREKLGQLDAAASSYQRALTIDPQHAPALSGLGNVQQQLGHLEAAVTSYEAALAADPSLAAAASNLGNVLRMQGKLEQAARACTRAVAANPNLAGAHNNLGNALVQLKRTAQALPCYERALALQPDFADALVNLGHALNALQRPQDALTAYQRALALDARAPWLYGAWLYTRLRICDWRDLGTAFAELGRRIDSGEPAATPFTVLAAPLSASQQHQCSRTYVSRMGFAPANAVPHGGSHQRIRIGYFSADFHGHATAYLMAELVERHDRSRFEVIAFSFGPRSSHPMRARLEAAFDQFIDVADLPDADIAERARAMQIDIAIDLKGYTEDCRTGIFAQRAAPLQVSYLGYPGTMGAPFIDYVLADATVIAPQHLAAYTEKVVFLPHCYQVNDSKRQISDHVFTRAEAQLPEQGFVFCCFNNNYKITPDLFDVWMRLLQAVPGSVLWLLEDNALAAANLKAAASQRGVDPQRLVFAPRLDMPRHLARQRLGDLFLDTLYCNAHTTASDALWVGLPLLTCLGQAFAGRVAASLLRAVGLAELVVERLEDYEQLALRLATDPTRLAILRQRLWDKRLDSPLFDAALFAKQAEAAFTAMWQRQVEGMSPEHIYVTL